MPTSTLLRSPQPGGFSGPAEASPASRPATHHDTGARGPERAQTGATATENVHPKRARRDAARDEARGTRAGAERPLVGIRNPLLTPCAAKGLREVTDTGTGEILLVRRGHDCGIEIATSRAQGKARRFMRLAASRVVLPKTHRVGVCHRVPSRNAQAVEVWKTGEGCAHYKGIMVCGSIWVCAVCGAKISERRRAELETATGLWRAQGGKVWLLTFTFSHGRFDHLGESLAKLAQARKLMKGGVGYQSIKARCGMVGTVTASEITHGQAHGWHPHIHELAFVSGGDKEAFRSQMYQRWRVSCLRAGLGEPSEKYGFDVRDGEAAAGYISKGLGPDTWGIESEMTKGHIKNGKRGSLSPFQILDCATDPEATPEHREHSRLLFLDYAQSTKGRRQLVWSPGLRDRFAVPELTDEEIASSVGEDSVLLASISLSDWEIIVRHDLLAVVLQLAEEGGADAVYRLIGFYR